MTNALYSPIPTRTRLSYPVYDCLRISPDKETGEQHETEDTRPARRKESSWAEKSAHLTRTNILDET
jgi:hypothetical protein